MQPRWLPRYSPAAAQHAHGGAALAWRRGAAAVAEAWRGPPQFVGFPDPEIRKLLILINFQEIADFGGTKSAQPILISLGKGRGLRPRPLPRLIRMGCADFDPPKSAISGQLIKIINFGG